MRLRVVLRARWSVLAPVGEDGRCALLDFLEGLSGELASDAERIGRRFRYLADAGSIRNPQQCHPVAGVDGIFELKGKHVRIFYFNFQGHVIVCSHGVLKPKKRQVLTEAGKADRLRDEIAKAARARTLVIEEEKG